MLAKAPTPIVVAILGFGVVFAIPLAGAVSFGVDAYSVPLMKSEGATPAYGQTWVGAWMRSSGWNGFETDMRTMRDNGVTPVVMWYYWGDPISPSCVQNGCNGNTKSNWDAMAREMATRADNIMGGRTFLVVLEPEFNKNGISSWETFDGYLEAQARAIKSIAPTAKIVVGFGHWGGWDIFDRAVGVSDYVGFQILRGSTRDTTSHSVAAADEIIRIAETLGDRWGKGIVVFDLGIASYGGWEWVQEAALRGVLAKRSELDAAGVKLIVWRYVHDNDYSSGYFGAAESYWGVKSKSGVKKPAYDELVALLRGGSAPATSTPTPTAAPTGAPASGAFSNVKGNEWWIQADVAGSPAKVEARVNGGAWTSLNKQSWGSWARSVHAPTGSSVELRATYGDGSTKSATYAWPPGAPTPTGSSAFDATFTGLQAKDWWVQVDVAANEALKLVEARVNGGAWVTLSKQSWGSYAKSVYVPTGGKVEFRATGVSGGTEVSQPAYR